MSKTEQVGAAIPSPASWTWQEVTAHLSKELFGRQLMRGTEMSVTRIQYQVEHAKPILAFAQRWPQLEQSAREAAWPDLIQAGYDATKEILPLCVRCGDCCRKSSPTLYQDDLEQVHKKLIPPEMLITLRRGEPVRSPFAPGLSHLDAECIKVRENPNTGACVFFDSVRNHCGIYDHRPLQCRAQACWDPSTAEELHQQPKLTRHDIFASLEELTTLLAEHDSRCAFEQLRQACDELAATDGKNADQIVDIVAFEDHYRQFVAEQLGLPAAALDLFFGRSFVELLRLFNLRVTRETDGTRLITPLAEDGQPDGVRSP